MRRPSALIDLGAAEVAYSPGDLDASAQHESDHRIEWRHSGSRFFVAPAAESD